MSHGSTTMPLKPSNNLFSGEPASVKPRTVPSADKRMATVCWDEQGILLLEWLDEGRTINATHFCEMLDHLHSAIKEKRRGLLSRWVVILVDNAPPHTASITQQKLKDLGFTVLPHPSYSPELAPSDYWLFPAISEPLRGRRYSSLQALSSAVHQWIVSCPTEWYATGLRKFEERFTQIKVPLIS